MHTIKNEKDPRRSWKVWLLEDKNGEILACGRKRDVLKVWYPRCVYAGIHTDTLYTYTDRTLY